MTAEEKHLQQWLRAGRRAPTGLEAMPKERREKCHRANVRLRQLRVRPKMQR